jgi:Ca2+-binding RTX toxin-like protein
MEEPMLIRGYATTTTPTFTKTVQPIYPVLPLVNEIYGTAGDDTGLFGTANDDNIYGLAGNDSLYGMAGNDTLDGGAGADVMAGGTGNDIYYVDDINDVVWEWGGEGTDLIRTSIDCWGLSNTIENLELIGSAYAGVGNDLDNTIVGNSADNILLGGFGNDTLQGGAGYDHLSGGDGADILDGGTFGDFMGGGNGDDTYYVDHPGDKVWEYPGGGTDLVRASFDHTLAAEVENLELIGSFAIDGTGNNLDNTLRGNSAANVLIGGGGKDMMYGGAGADTFKFIAVWEAAPLGAGFTDYIPDFNEADGDKIDLSAIDANLFVAGDQAFNPIGVNVAFTGAAGQLRFNGGFLEGDVNGDRIADFQIHLDVAGLSAGALVL